MELRIWSNGQTESETMAAKIDWKCRTAASVNRRNVMSLRSIDIKEPNQGAQGQLRACLRAALRIPGQIYAGFYTTFKPGKSSRT